MNHRPNTEGGRERHLQPMSCPCHGDGHGPVHRRRCGHFSSTLNRTREGKRSALSTKEASSPLTIPTISLVTLTPPFRLYFSKRALYHRGVTYTIQNKVLTGGSEVFLSFPKACVVLSTESHASGERCSKKMHQKKHTHSQYKINGGVLYFEGEIPTFPKKK